MAKEKIAAGIDIGTSAVKYVKLKIGSEKTELSGFGVEPIKIELSEVIKKAFHSQGLDVVNFSVSGPSTLLRYVAFPKMSKEELSKALKFEAQKHIPFSVNEVFLDAAIVKDDLPDNKMLILIAAVKKDWLNQRLKIIKDSGLKAKLVDMDSLALINAFNFSFPKTATAARPKSIALVNIGAAFTNLNILEDSVPLLSRDINIAGNNFTQKISDIFGIDFKTAENLKLNPEKDKIEKMTGAVETVLSNLATELRISFDYYESQHASSVAKIFLSGGGSSFMGIKDSLANLLGIEVEYWDSFSRISIPAGIEPEKLKNLSSCLAVATGLALR